jgi:hypothetical protein
MKNKPKETNPLPTVEDAGERAAYGMFDRKLSVAETKEAEMERMRRKDRKHLRKSPHNCIVVTMHHRNNTTRTFIINTKASHFEYQAKAYLLHMTNARNDLTRKLPHLHYSEESSMPLNHEVVKQGDKAWFSVTPATMLDYLKMEVIKAFVSSLELNKYLKMLVVISSVTGIAAIISLILALNGLRSAL